MARHYINSGANAVTLKSGDEGLYVDVCLEQLLAIVEEHRYVLRPWVEKSTGTEFNNVRIFVKPNDGGSRMYTHYLEVVAPKS